MRVLRAVPNRRHLILWLGLAVVVIGGLLGMHALNLHAQTPHTTTAAAHSAAADDGIAHGATTHETASPAALHCDDCDQQPAGHEAAMACVLALLITLLLLPAPRLLAAIEERIRWLAAIQARHVVGHVPTRSLFELSVIRT